MVALRLDPRLRGRLDPSDVLQDAFLEATRKLEDYIENSNLPFYLWLRLITVQKLVDLHRMHLGAKARDARREFSIDEPRFPQASTDSLAIQLVARSKAPSQVAIRKELEKGVQDALNTMNPIDREILALRHFEELSNVEAARILEIEPKAASKRHSRALRRLRGIMKGSGDAFQSSED